MEYTREDHMALRSELRKKGLLFAGLGALVLAGIITLFVLRLQAACMFFTFFSVSAFAFFAYAYLAPPLAYRKYLKEMQRGQQRINRGVFVRVEPGEDVRDGLPCRPRITADDEGVEHRFYFDCNKILPNIEPGARLIVYTYGQSIKKLEIQE